VRIGLSRDRNLILAGVLVALVFVVVGAVWLSQSTETLDTVAENFGAKESPVWNPPLPDYEISGFEGNTVMNIVTGIAFTLIILGVTLVVGRGLLKVTRTRG
jgi:hypothetical protein